MPNYITNHLTITAENDQELERIHNYVEGVDADGNEQSVFSLQCINPMPIELEDTKSPSDASPDESKRLKLLYGEDNWYDWRVKNWGTKWDTCNVAKEGNFIEFDTAWRTPLESIKYLSRKFPTVRFLVEYADEDWGHNCGFYKYLNGTIVEEYYPEEGEEAEHFSCEILGTNYNEKIAYREELNEKTIENSSPPSKTPLCSSCGQPRNTKKTICPNCLSKNIKYNHSGKFQCNDCGFPETE